jgi:hypothetical protein
VALAFIWLGLGGSASGIVYCLACGFDELFFGMLFLSTLGFVGLCYGLRDLVGHLTVDEAGKGKRGHRELAILDVPFCILELCPHHQRADHQGASGFARSTDCPAR